MDGIFAHGEVKMKLYEIDAQIEKLIEQNMDPETGELTNTEEIEALAMEKEKKAENIALWIKDLEAEINALKAERDSFSKRISVAQNKEESLKRYLELCLNGEKLETTRCRVSYRTSKSVEVDEDSFIRWAATNRDEFLRYKMPEIDKTALKEALKTEDIPYARLKENKSMIVR